MKKFNLEMLRLTSDEILGRSQMKKITGGRTFTCYCGNVTQPTSGGFYVWAGNVQDAIEVAQAQCEGDPVTCGGAVQ